MKKKMFLTAGILIGIGSVYGAKLWLAPGAEAKVSAELRTEHPATRRTTEQVQTEKMSVDLLASKIERLRLWACGKDPALNREAAMKILMEWADSDAHAALDFVVTAPRFPRRNFAYAIPLAKICQSDPKEVIAWLAYQIADTCDRNEIAGAIIRRTQGDAPVAALELASSPGVSIDNDDLGELLGRVARTQPQIALQNFAEKNPGCQKEMIGPMLLHWAQANPSEALAWFLGRGENDAEAARSLASGCLKSGKYTLADMIPRLRLGTEQVDRMLYQLSRDGSVLDPKTLGLFSERARRRATEIVARDLEDAPDRVMAFVKAAVGSNEQAEALLGGWSSWLQSDRKAALAWLQQLPDRQLAGELTTRLERNEQLRDPHKALVVAKTISNQEEREKIVGAAVHRLAWEAPAEAAAWLAQNPSDAPRPAVFCTLARRYLERDDAGAMAWIARLGAGEARDEALSAAAVFWVEKEVDFATTSMAVIGDAQKRQQCMFNLYRNLNRTNSAKADQWLEAQGLSAEVRQSWKALGQTRTYYDD